MELMHNGIYKNFLKKSGNLIYYKRKCTANLPNNYRFAKTQVLCEGYSYPDDPYVTAGSCGVEYSLMKVGGNSNYNNKYYNNNNYGNYSRSSSKSSWISFILIGGIIFLVYKTCIQSNGGNFSTTKPL